MSIGRRLIDLARAELNSLLDRAGRADEEDDTRRTRTGWDDDGSGLHGLSDEELAAEIERRKRAREEVEEAVNGRRRGPSARPDGTRPYGDRFRRAEPPRRTAAGDEAIRKAYAALEVPAGSDFDTVRKAYRRLMRKYHPDLHTSSPDKQRAANDLAQRLTEAYKLLEKQLRR
jgi:DnaJ-domain-containing protein 1